MGADGPAKPVAKSNHVPPVRPQPEEAPLPFRSFFEEVKPGEAKPVYTAEAGDIEVFISSRPLPGQGQASTGYNFAVGGPELGENAGGGLYRMQSEFNADVNEGDELWVSVEKEAIAWSERPVALTVLVRSKKG